MASSSTNDGFVLLWSGGKDAMLAHDVLHSQSPRRIGALLTTVVEQRDTVTMHGTPLALIQRQAEALGIPLHVMEVPADAPNEVYENRLQRVVAPLMSDGYQTIVAGDLFLQDIRTYREKICQDIGVRPLFPLWQRDTTWLARRFVERGYRAVVTSVDTTQLDTAFLGRSFDTAFLNDLPHDVDPCGEHGEFHTFVVDGPPFADPVPIAKEEMYGQDRMRYVQLRETARGTASGEEERGDRSPPRPT